jgi:hypothetical protein
VAAADAAQGLADGGVAGVEAMAGRAVGAGERGQAAAERRQAVAGRQRGEVGAHRVRGRRDGGRPALSRAPGAEAGEVGAVGAQRLGRVRRGAVAGGGHLGRAGRDLGPSYGGGGDGGAVVVAAGSGSAGSRMPMILHESR